MGSQRDVAIGTGLFLGTLLVFLQTVGFEFVDFDDNIYILNVAWVKAGLSLEGLWIAFTEPMAATNWTPMVGLSLMLDAELYGLDPTGFHLTNVLLHATNAVLVFALLRSLTGSAWRSALVAALFAVHPLRVESVAWVSSRKDVLSTAFGLLALLSYARWTRRREPAARLLSLGCFALALMSKPIWVTLPVLLLLLDFWPLGRLQLQDLRIPPRGTGRGREAVLLPRLVEKLPYLALSAAVSLMTLSYQDMNIMHLGLESRLAHALGACGWYLQKTLWPTQLNVFQPHPYISVAGGVPWSGFALGTSGMLLAAVSVACLLAHRHGYLLMGWLWFLVTLLPVLGLLAQAGMQGVADRYTYLPHIGLFAALVFGGWELLTLWLRPPAARHAAVAASSALLLLLASASVVQSRTWRDNDALFERALEVTPRNAVVLKAMASHRYRNGRFEEARDLFLRATDVFPQYRSVLRLLGRTQIQLGDAEGAIETYTRLLELGGRDPALHARLAYLHYLDGDVQAASRHAAQLAPRSAHARRQLGWLLRESGDLDAARAVLEGLPHPPDEDPR